MARKKHLINVHTSTGTTAPTGASLYLGEIAVQHTHDDPALWIKVGSAETSTEYEKFIGLTEITNIFNMSQILGSGYTYSGIPYVNSATTIADAYSALTKELIDDELVTAAALNDLNDRIPEPVDLEPLSASVVTNKTNIEIISAWVEDNELVTAAALNDLNDRIIELSGSTGDNTEMIEYIQENEEVVAAALNNLNNRVSVVETHMTGDYIPITGYILASGITEEELTLRETDTINEALGKLQKQSLDNEEAIAAGLNDLNERVTENAAAIAKNTGVTVLSGVVRSLQNEVNNLEDSFLSFTGDVRWDLSAATVSLSSATQSLSAAVQSISAKTSGILTINANGVEQGRYSPSANTTIDLQIVQDVTGADVLLTGYELASGTTEEELAIVATDTVNEAFGKIQKQNYDNEAVVAGALNDLDERILALEAGGSGDVEALSAAVVTKELAIAASLNDLNDRINDLSDESDLLSQQIQELSGSSGGGGLTGVTYGGTNATVTNQVAAIPTASTSSFGVVKLPSSSFITGSSGTINVRTGTTTISVPRGDQFLAVSAATTGHVGNGDIHVTSAQKTAWTNGANSGASAYTAVTALSAATTGINNTLTAHTGNGNIHVTTNEKSTWNGKQDAISDLTTIRNNASSGAAAYTAVTAHTGTTIPNRTSGQIHLPTVTSSDNGKILRVVGGQWALEDPSTITYSSSTPSGGRDGDVWIQIPQQS
jgi:hypothetical protein